MPILFRDAGLSQQTASLIAALFPLGGVGAIFFGFLMDRFNGNLIIAVGFALTAVAVYAIGQVAGTLAVPGLVAAAALVVKQLAHPEARAAGAAARGEELGH